MEGGWLLNGNKRWIGNADRDIVIVWAKDADKGNMLAFIVENKYKGVTSIPMKNKMALRIV